jgi:hypothetical protein
MTNSRVPASSDESQPVRATVTRPGQRWSEEVRRQTAQTAETDGISRCYFRHDPDDPKAKNEQVRGSSAQLKVLSKPCGGSVACVLFVDLTFSGVAGVPRPE